MEGMLAQSNNVDFSARVQSDLANSQSYEGKIHEIKNNVPALINQHREEILSTLYPNYLGSIAFLEFGRIDGKAYTVVAMSGSVGLQVDGSDEITVLCTLKEFISTCDDLSGCSFSETDVSGVDFSNKKLVGTNFERAIAKGANFSGADMYGAQMRGANLENAELSYAFLCKADLRSANLTDSKMNATCLQSADLRGTIIVPHVADCVDYSDATFGDKVVCDSIPEGFDINNPDPSVTLLGTSATKDAIWLGVKSNDQEFTQFVQKKPASNICKEWNRELYSKLRAIHSVNAPELNYVGFGH